MFTVNGNIEYMRIISVYRAYLKLVFLLSKGLIVDKYKK